LTEEEWTGTEGTVSTARSFQDSSQNISGVFLDIEKHLLRPWIPEILLEKLPSDYFLIQTLDNPWGLVGYR